VVTDYEMSGSPADWPVLPPVGKPIDRTRITLQAVPGGRPEEGEILIAGNSLCEGYLYQPALNAEKLESIKNRVQRCWIRLAAIIPVTLFGVSGYVETERRRRFGKAKLKAILGRGHANVSKRLQAHPRWRPFARHVSVPFPVPGRPACPDNYQPGPCRGPLHLSGRRGHVLVFTVPDTEPVAATVDQAAATQAAIDWARRFDYLNDLDILAVEFQTRPTRFWRVTFLASRNGQTVHLYAVVLPDGRPAEPTVRAET
jgi:hypothetical protein